MPREKSLPIRPFHAPVPARVPARFGFHLKCRLARLVITLNNVVDQISSSNELAVHSNGFEQSEIAIVEYDLGKEYQRRGKKTRTHEHVLADLGVNYVERQILLRGWSVDRVEHDYGIDLFMSTYSDEGEIENGRVLLQVKATEHLKRSKNGAAITFSLSRRDLRYWLPEPSPVILVVYDGICDEAYWLYLQRYFATERHIDLATAPGNVTVRIPTTNRLNQEACSLFKGFRDLVLAQFRGNIHHG
jgi:hypothetical protein